MTAVTIRLASPEEYEAVDALVRESYEHDYGPRDHVDDEVHTARSRASHFEVWVAVDDFGELLGSITTSRDRG